MWECVRLELQRQEHYCHKHHICKYHNSNEEHPLSARITCATCGCSFMLLESKRVGEGGRKYWRCSSFQGKHGTLVEGRTFMQKPMALWSKYPDSSYAQYRANHRKLPEERQMLCTDAETLADVPEKTFVKAWNQINSHRQRYVASFARIANKSDSPLLQYRAGELVRLVNEGQRIETFDYELSLKVHDHIEVMPEGKLAVLLLTGTSITV